MHEGRAGRGGRRGRDGHDGRKGRDGRDGRDGPEARGSGAGRAARSGRGSGGRAARSGGPGRDPLAEAARRAARERPAEGYRLEDFDDVPEPGARGPARQAPRPRTGAEEGTERLQKALANAGVASRRVCEQYIVAGRVEVNGRVVTELGTRVDPRRDRVSVDGTAVQFDRSRRYLMLNKPTGVVSTMRDEQGRPDLRRYTRGFPERLFNVGRLDAETSGLLLLTNDGELANVLAHPSYGVEKTYVAKVAGEATPQTLQRLLRGVELEDGPIRADAARILAARPGGSATLVEVTLHSGRNRIVRRMFDHIGHPVQELVRRSFGPLHLGTLRAGEVRELTRMELGRILTLARRAERRPEAPQARSGRRSGADGS